MSEAWYVIVEAASALTQGDLIFDCPLLTWDSGALRSAAGVAPPGTLKDCITACREDVVVMTQACDLENRKVENVVLCPHMPMVRQVRRSSDDQKE